jgi:DNA repair protein RecN (Recombination protein N)
MKNSNPDFREENLLVELRVKNLGIIEDMNWRLGEGLNVITGETGAGKSLIIDAVELLVAGKADEEVIRHGADQAQIEGVFSLPPR